MKKFFITGMLSATIFLVNFGTATADKLVAICKALGMTDDMAYFMIQYKDGTNDGFSSVTINNRRIFVMEEDDTQNNIIICGILAQALD